MKKGLLTAAVVALALAPLRADVTLVQTMTMEGAAAPMMGGQMPTMTTRIKGMKSRTDIDMMGQKLTAIADLDQKRVILLQSQTKVAQVITPQSAASGGPALTVPDIDVSLKATGKTQVIDGMRCEEHAFTMTLPLSALGGQAQMPPESAAMMKDVTMAMTGSMWVARNAPGASEYTAFGKAALRSGLLASISGMQAGASGGLDKLMAATVAAPGVPYLTEITMVFQGTGPMVEAMKQMGPIKMVQKTSSVSTDAIGDDVFRLPEGYTIEK